MIAKTCWGMMRKFSWMLLVLLASGDLVHSGPWTRGNSDYYRRNNPSVKSESSELVDDTVKKEIVATAERDARNNVSAFKWWCSGCLFGGIALSWADRLEPSMPKNDFSGKSAEYAEIYEEAYKAEVKKIRRSSAWRGKNQAGLMSESRCIGCIGGCAVIILVPAALGFAAFMILFAVGGLI